MSTRLDESDIALLKLQELENQTNEYLDRHMQEFMDVTVIPEIRDVARAMNLPDEFIDNIKFIKTGKNTGKVINTWGTSQKPLARWFNDGTKDHFIAPVSKKAHHWITLLGNDAFSKGHMVRGLPKTEAMEIGLFLGKKKLIQAVKFEMKRSKT